ncbi:hypothetical protein EDD17DRAFT_1085033 [Pisolithus thermaeus]|nr:hypothetical protein EV401DRAFT_958486 [Pisolithus croceorrhizus]KAI6154409.1 hypothetical protein EDD17DRAFT_1085033 [Pisolithus thermaeus]
MTSQMMKTYLSAELSKADLGIFFTFLVPHVPRWGSIEVHVVSYEHIYAFPKTILDPSDPSAAQLQALRLYHHEESDGDITRSAWCDQLTLFNGSAPRLRNVSLWGVHVDWTESRLHSPNLVELELAYHTPGSRLAYLFCYVASHSTYARENVSLIVRFFLISM